METVIKNWLFIRGLSREKRHWGSFPQDFCERMAAKAHFLDLAGAGSKSRQRSFSSIAKYTDEMNKELIELKKQHDGEWGVVSVSMGGMVAMDWCARYPETFKAAILVNCTARNLSPVHHRLSIQAFSMIVKLFMGHDLLKRERAILEFTTNKQDISQELVEKFASFSRDHPMTRANFIRQIFAASQFKAPASLSLPLLFLAGRKDRLASSECSVALAKHYSSKISLHDSAGHDLPLDDPQWIINEGEKFLTSLS